MADYFSVATTAQWIIYNEVISSNRNFVSDS